MNKKVAFHNLGCKVNSYELDAMQRLMTIDGYETVSFDEKADVYIVNTCTVTNIADRKSRQMLHRAKKNNPEAIVVAVGCYVQSHMEEIMEDAGIDLCIGNNQKGRIAEIVREYLAQKENEEIVCKNELSDIGQEKQYEELIVSETAERCRAFIKIQDGCNQFCSYCIIPYARGRVRSRSEESIIEEIKRMSDNGYREFVLTGIHISSYGTDFQNEKPRADLFGEEQLLELIEKIAEIPGVQRIRLGSLEPRIITEKFLDRLSSITKICPHFHLSLQSGCNATLKRMNRHYTAEEFFEKTELIRKFYEHPAITTDVIVGFPGETEEEFEECRSFLEKIHFFEMHIFKYSKRKNTPAAVMPMQLTDAKKAGRSDILEALEKKHSAEFRSFYIGRRLEVLIEEQKEIEGKKYWVGHSPEYVKVAFPCDNNHEENRVNSVCMVQIESLLGDVYLCGERLT